MVAVSDRERRGFDRFLEKWQVLLRDISTQTCLRVSQLRRKSLSCVHILGNIDIFRNTWGPIYGIPGVQSTGPDLIDI